MSKKNRNVDELREISNRNGNRGDAKMNRNNKLSFFLFSIYRLIIIVSMVLYLGFKQLEGVLMFFMTIDIIILATSYWYFVIKVLYKNDGILGKMVLYEKIILICNVMTKLAEYYIVYICIYMKGKTFHIFWSLGVMLIDIFLEYKIYQIIRSAKTRISKDVKCKETKLIYSEWDVRHVRFLYVISILYIIASFVQIVRFIIGGAVLLEFLIRFAVIAFLLNDFVKVSVNEKKIYVNGINYIVNILIFLVEAGIYWIMNYGYNEIYLKVALTIVSLLCFEGLLVGQFAKRYNEARSNMDK